MALEVGVHTPYWDLPEQVRKEFANTLGRVLSRAVNNSMLRALIRSARREQAEGRPPRAFREMFRVLREVAGE